MKILLIMLLAVFSFETFAIDRLEQKIKDLKKAQAIEAKQKALQVNKKEVKKPELKRELTQNCKKDAKNMKKFFAAVLLGESLKKAGKSMNYHKFTPPCKKKSTKPPPTK